MKYTFNFLLALFFSGNCFALKFPIVNPEPGSVKPPAAVKKDSCKKTTRKNAVAKELNICNQKTKKEPTPENTIFIGPLSWKPALLY